MAVPNIAYSSTWFLNISHDSRLKDIPIFIDRPLPTEETAPGQVEDTPLQQKTVADLDAIEDPFEFQVHTQNTLHNYSLYLH
jgi:hypothetical protein